jgi:prepilin-type N-terminal cleavage/methylation domain-containing protein
MRSPTHRARGFTLIELVVVIAIISIVTVLVVVRSGSLDFWREQSYVRRLSDMIVFLHHQAVADQAFYRIDFDLDAQTYRIGVMRPEEDVDDQLKDIAAEAGSLSLEFAAFLNPSLGSTQTVIPPPLYPSLADPVKAPEGVRITRLRTMRGVITKGQEYLMFSPRRFSEFGVIQLSENGAPITILVNPFTGTTDIYHKEVDFEWAWGKKKTT